MIITKHKRYGKQMLEGTPSSVIGADSKLHGYIDPWYHGKDPWVGISANGRMGFNKSTWEKFKSEVEQMFKAVDEAKV